MSDPAPPAEALSRLASAYPDWKIAHDTAFGGVGGRRWWAERLRMLTEPETARGLRHTLTAPTAVQLEELLAGQARLQASALQGAE